MYYFSHINLQTYHMGVMRGDKGSEQHRIIPLQRQRKLDTELFFTNGNSLRPAPYWGLQQESVTKLNQLKSHYVPLCIWDGKDLRSALLQHPELATDQPVWPAWYSRPKSLCLWPVGDWLALGEMCEPSNEHKKTFITRRNGWKWRFPLYIKFEVY